MISKNEVKGQDHTLENTPVKSIFDSSANEIDDIFTSFSQLYEVYTGSFKGLKESLANAATLDLRKISNTQAAFDRIAGTVKEKEEQLRSQLYTQGVVLLVGAAESILRGMFSTLVLDNFRKLKIKKEKSLSFSIQEVISAQTDEDLGSLILDKLEENGNPQEKLNFQNMKQLQGILNGYLGMNIDDLYLIEPHKYMQIRHIVVHNQAYIDQQFIDNLEKVKIDIGTYAVGEKIKISEQDYKDCFAHLSLLFDQVDSEIIRLNLSHVVV